MKANIKKLTNTCGTLPINILLTMITVFGFTSLMTIYTLCLEHGSVNLISIMFIKQLYIVMFRIKMDLHKV